MALPYDFNAMRLGLQGFQPQLSNMGMLEFHLNGILPGAKEILMLSLKSIDMPNGRSVAIEKIPYLNGDIKHPGKVGDLGDLSVTFYDYIDGRTREILHKWFDLVHDEKTGLGLPSALIKTNAHMVLFGRDGIARATYFLKGIWPTQEPSIPSIDFSNGTIVTMAITFAVDFMFDQFGEEVQLASGALGIAAGAGTILG